MFPVDLPPYSPFERGIGIACAQMRANWRRFGRLIISKVCFPYAGRELDEIFEASSGSPLFAASIVRLVKLGENRREVVEKWKGRDGEEVRSFAFQRELERLTGMESRVLYAVLLLGETTLSDIAEVVEMQPRAVRDQVAGLQAYHLMANVAKGQGDSAISVPDELQAVVDLVKTQLCP